MKLRYWILLLAACVVGCAAMQRAADQAAPYVQHATSQPIVEGVASTVPWGQVALAAAAGAAGWWIRHRKLTPAITVNTNTKTGDST